MHEHDQLPEPVETAIMLAALPMATACAFLCVLIVNIGSVLLLPVGLVFDGLRSLAEAIHRSHATAEARCREMNGRSGGIRTHDPLSPRQVR